MANVRQYKITFKNIKEGEIPCTNPTIKLLGVSDNVVQKCEFTKNSVTFSIYEDAIEGLQGTCINFTILCESCGKCPPKDGKICFCNDFTECEPCHDCINGVCVNTCPDMLCVDDKCVNCETNDDCPGNTICIAGNCQCPPEAPYYDEITQKCYECQSHTECGPCKRCVDGGCVDLNCICDPEIDDCVECNQSSECGPNECCINNECDCCPGYVFDPTIQECVPEPPCTSDDDLDPCQICVDGEIQDIICPDPNDVCINGDCVPIPCEGPCDDATDCGPGCGCLNGQCVDCTLLDCVTCAQTIGCECVNGACVKDNDPCAQYACTTNCGDRPDCECQPDGSCEEKECEGESTLEKNEDNCQLVYNLETSECCPCTNITVDNQILGASINNATNKLVITSIVEVRKGTVTTPLGIADLHRVDQEQFEDIMDNEEPTQGQVRVKATYVYAAIPSGLQTTEVVDITPLFDVAGTGFSQKNIEVNVPGRQYPAGLRTLKSVTLTYTITSELTFESGCTYTEGQVIGTYQFTDAQTEVNLVNELNINTPGWGSNAEFWIAKTLTSDTCANPEVKWYRAGADVNGNITAFGVIPFRKAYVTKLSPTTYTDFIDEPDENPGPTDNHGELFSGHYYKVTTECACTNEATAYYASTCQDPGRLVFCDPQTALVTFDPCGKKFTFDAAFVTDCLPNYDYYGANAATVPDEAKLRYSIHVNGNDTALTGSIKIADINGLIYNLGQMFTSTELIEYIEIRWSHDNCDECTIRIDSDVDMNLPNYSVVCEPNGTTNTTYIITFTNWTGITSVTVSGNVATPGSPTVSVNVVNGTTSLIGLVQFAGCPGTVPMNIQLPENCCDDLIVTLTQVAGDCDDANYSFVAVSNPVVPGTFSFSVDGTFVTSNSTGLFSVPRSSDPDSVSVSFDPTAPGCENATNSIIVNKTSSIIINTLSPENIVTCGSGSVQVVYNTIGYTGTVTYTVTGAGQTVANLNGSQNLIINVSGNPGDTKFITIDSNTLQDVNGNTCIAFEFAAISIQWIAEPNVTSITFDPIEGCEGETVSFVVNGTGSTAVITRLNFLGVSPAPITVNLNQQYTIVLGSSSGDGIITATSVTAGGCTTPENVIGVVNILDSPDIVDVQFECVTPGNPASDILVTVFGTQSATVLVNADEGNVLLTEGPLGEYNGTIDSTNGGDSVTINMTLGPCTTSVTEDVAPCACDDSFDVQIRLGGVSINADSGCVGEGSNYTSLVTGGNAPFTYEWTVNGVVQSVANFYNHIFAAGNQTLILTVIDSEGCETGDIVNLTGNPTPVVTINGIINPCENAPTVYTASIVNGPASTYQWKLDAVNTVTTASYTYTPLDLLPHTISLVVINGNGCVSAEATKIVTAQDCCEICDETWAFVREGVGFNRFIDETMMVHSIPVSPFECVPVATPSALNTASAGAIQAYLAAHPNQCGTPTVQWESVLTGSGLNCLSESFSSTSGADGIWIVGAIINGNTHTFNFKIANATGGTITSIPGNAEANSELLIAGAFAAEDIGVLSINTVYAIGAPATALDIDVEITGVLGVTVSLLFATTSAGVGVSQPINDVLCTGAFGDSYQGQCIKITVLNSSITPTSIYTVPAGDPADVAAFLGPCQPE